MNPFIQFFNLGGIVLNIIVDRFYFSRKILQFNIYGCQSL